MKTYTQILYQIVFSTRNRVPALTKPHRDRLFMYMSGVLANKKCHLYRINGVEDHIHILTHLNPAISLSALIKDIKLSSGELIRETKLFPSFPGWQEGYGAFTYSFDQKSTLIRYVMNQEIHHRRKSFREEFIDLLHEQGVEFEEKYLV